MGDILFTKHNDELDIETSLFLNDDGSISVNAEHVAIALGWTQTKKLKGKSTTYIRWERMIKFSEELGFPHKWGKNMYMPESLVYRLAMKANNENANKFQAWLADEVIPSIRKTGNYSVQKLTREQKISEGLIAANEVIKEQQQLIAQQNTQIQQMQPKADFFDRLQESSTTILVRDLAHLINQTLQNMGVKTTNKVSQGTMFEYLRENGFLIKAKGPSYNTPTQRSIDLGIMQIKTSTITTNTNIRTSFTPKITSKGIIYFMTTILAHYESDKDVVKQNIENVLQSSNI